MSTIVSSLAELKQQLLAAGEVVVGEPGGFLVSRKIAGLPWVFRVNWELRPGLLHFFVVMRTKVPADRRAAVIEKLNEYNKDPIAGFHLGDHVVYATYAWLDEGRVSLETVKRCLGLCEEAMVKRDPELAALVANVGG